MREMVRGTLFFGVVGSSLGLLFVVPALNPNLFVGEDVFSYFGWPIGVWALISVLGSILGMLGGIRGGRLAGLAMIVGGLLNLSMFAIYFGYGLPIIVPVAILVVGGLLEITAQDAGISNRDEVR